MQFFFFFAFYDFERILTLPFTHWVWDNYRWMFILVMSLLFGSFVPLLSISIIVFWPHWSRVLVIGWLSVGGGLSQARFLSIWVSRSSVSSSFSGWCGLYLCLWGLFFLLVWVVLAPIGSADVSREGSSRGGCFYSNWCR